MCAVCVLWVFDTCEGGVVLGVVVGAESAFLVFCCFYVVAVE